MSGSPVFLEGRFAGALAFGWPGALKPLAGVTPAAEMLALPREPLPATTPGRSRLQTGPQLTDLMRMNSNTAALAAQLDLPVQATAPGAPLTTRSGWPDPADLAYDLIGRALAGEPGKLPPTESWFYRPLRSGWSVSRTGGTGRQSAEAVQPALVAGSACAVPLVTGAAQLGAIGTVTQVVGDEVLLFGHPFMQRGPVDLPLATAEVVTVFPSRQMSFKMGSVGEIVGAVYHDQRAGLAGRLGPAPDLIPVRVDLQLPDARGGRTYDFAVVDDPLLTPTLVFWTLYNAVLAEGDDASKQTLGYRLTTHWSGDGALEGEPLVLSGTVNGPGGVANLAAEWMLPLGILLNNPYRPLRLEGVTADLELTRPAAAAHIVGLSGPRRLTAGQGAVFSVELVPEDGERTRREIRLDVPAHLPAGTYRLVAASAAELFALEAQRAAGRFQPTDLAAMVEILRTARAQDTLVLALLAAGRGVVVQGREMSALPPRLVKLMRSANLEAAPTLADYVWRHDETTSWVLDGHAVSNLSLTPSPNPYKEVKRP